jgi:hypothetical protein
LRTSLRSFPLLKQWPKTQSDQDIGTRLLR